MKKYFSISFSHYTPALAVGVLVLLLLSSCFTGVESTKKIELSKDFDVQSLTLEKVKAMIKEKGGTKKTKAKAKKK